MYFQDKDTEGMEDDKILDVYYDDDLPGTTSGIYFVHHDYNTIEVKIQFWNDFLLKVMHVPTDNDVYLI
jgi:hypothetical protein